MIMSVSQSVGYIVYVHMTHAGLSRKSLDSRLSEDLLFAARNLNIGDCDCGGVQVVSGDSFVAHGSTGCSPICISVLDHQYIFK